MSAVVLRRFCDHCGVYREPHETRWAGPSHAAVAVCTSCGGALRKEEQRVTVPIAKALFKAFGYPLSPVIAVSTVLAALASAFISFVPLIGGLLSATIVVAYLFLILRASAEGRDDLASDAEVAGRLLLWLEPLVRYLLTWLVAFSGAGLALFALGWPAGAPVVLALTALGAFYLPAGLIVSAHREGCLGALNPVPAVRIIARIPGPYFLTLGFLLVALVLGACVVYLTALLLGGVPILGGLALRVFGLYAPVVMARQLGVLVHEHREEL